MVDMSASAGRLHGTKPFDGLGLLAFVWRHVWLALDECASRSDFRRPEVLLRDGTIWELVSRRGVLWHLRRGDGREYEVSTAKVERLKTKWDYKS